jgi:hypothetical protein
VETPAIHTERRSRCYIRIITACVQLENKNTSRESQGACRKEELTGGKLPVVK